MNKDRPEPKPPEEGRPRETTFEAMFDHRLITPETEDGMGSTLGEDVSSAEQRRRDARYGADAGAEDAARRGDAETE